MSKSDYYQIVHPRFSRPWWFQRVRNALWVTLITVLIWVFADMQLTESRQMTATIRLTVPQAASLALLEREGSNPVPRQVRQKNIAVAFEAIGSRHSLESFERQLKSPITYDLSKAAGPGEVTIPTKDILNAFAAQVKAGLTFRSAEPNVIMVRLDELIHQQVPVELVYTGAQLAEVPSITMPVTVARSLWDQIISRTGGKPVLRTATRDLKDQPTGTPISVTFDVIPSIADVPVEPQRPSVTVKLTISQRTLPKTLTVTVRVLIPPSWAEDETWNRYELLGKDGSLEWRKEITVSGPKEDLDKLEAKDIDAYIELIDEDKAPVSWLTRKVTIRFPPGLSVKLVGEPPSVNFKLIERPKPVAPSP